jgi:hypothetical protein
MHRRLRLLPVLCLLSCLSLEDVSATVVLPADFATVVAGSGVIVHGRVVRVESHLAGSGRAIESVVTLSVIQALKGDIGATVSFRVPNGQVGRYRRVLVGAPEFTQGDEVVVFLDGRPPAMPSVFGLNQGLYRVARDRASRAMVMPPRMASGEGRIVRGDPGRLPLTVEAFTREVHAVLERTR